LSPASLNERLNQFVVQCNYKKKQVLAAQKEEQTTEDKEEVPEEYQNMSDYDWEAEKIAEIEKVISSNVTEDNWEEIKSSKKLPNPNTMEAQILGSSSITKLPSSFQDGLGDRSQVANNQMSIFENKEVVDEKLKEASKTEKRVEADVQARESKAQEMRYSWETDYLNSINDVLENKKDLDTIKKIANESYETQPQKTPTGKMGMFDDATINVDEIDSTVKETAQERAEKKDEEWEKQQLEAINKQITTASKLENKHMTEGVHKVSEEIGAGEGFKHGKDELSMFEPAGLENLKQEKTTKEAIEESKTIKRKELGVREAKVDKSWDDYEAQKNRTIQEKARENPVLQEFLNKVSRKGEGDMEEFLVEAGKKAQSPDATTNQGGFKRVT